MRYNFFKHTQSYSRQLVIVNNAKRSGFITIDRGISKVPIIVRAVRWVHVEFFIGYLPKYGIYVQPLKSFFLGPKSSFIQWRFISSNSNAPRSTNEIFMMSKKFQGCGHPTYNYI